MKISIFLLIPRGLEGKRLCVVLPPSMRSASCVKKAHKQSGAVMSDGGDASMEAPPTTASSEVAYSEQNGQLPAKQSNP